MEAKLSEFLKDGKDWERRSTSMPGVFVLKMPAYKGAPIRLAVELNPVDSERAYVKISYFILSFLA